MLLIGKECEFFKPFQPYCTCSLTQSPSDLLPEEDKEMQQALMAQVLEILLEVENLSTNERACVEDGLTFIRPDGTETLTQREQIGYAYCFYLGGTRISFKMFLALI
jgi:hypothetical protein